MPEVKVKDVLIQLDDDDPTQIAGPYPKYLAVLREPDTKRTLFMDVGWTEAHGLAYDLTRQRPPRPATSDLMASLLRATGAKVDRVEITTLEGNAFYAASCR